MCGQLTNMMASLARWLLGVITYWFPHQTWFKSSTLENKLERVISKTAKIEESINAKVRLLDELNEKQDAMFEWFDLCDTILRINHYLEADRNIKRSFYNITRQIDVLYDMNEGFKSRMREVGMEVQELFAKWNTHVESIQEYKELLAKHAENDEEAGPIPFPNFDWMDTAVEPEVELLVQEWENMGIEPKLKLCIAQLRLTVTRNNGRGDNGAV